MTGFVFHPEAYEDLDEIWEYIAARDLDAADRLLDEHYAVMRTLASFPHAGHIRADLAPDSIRFYAVRDYVLAYAPEEKPLVIIAVLHGRRNPRVLAANLRDRKS